MANDLYIPPEAQALLDHWCGDGLARGWPNESRDQLWFGFDPERAHLFDPVSQRRLD